MPEILEYPVFEIPTNDETTQAAEPTYLPGPLFDFEKGDFVRDGRNRVVMTDGLTTFTNWVQKNLQTQQGACLSYMDIGVDYEGALSEDDHGAAEAELERSITEALLMHPMMERVKDFVFTWANDALEISFTVKGRDIPAFTIGMTVV